jgi:adenylate kinase family enzyme
MHFRARRIWIVGNSGSGKSTLASRIARAIHAPHVELDALHHGPDWTPRSHEWVASEVARVCETDAWVVDGNYRALEPIVRARTEAIVWIDLPRIEVIRQLAPRSLGRILRGTELWNGNRERWSALLAWDPNESVIRWAWTQHENYFARYEKTSRQAAGEGIAFYRLRSRDEVNRFGAWVQR